MKEETANDRDWPANNVFLNCYEDYFSHTKPEPFDPNNQMLEGGEDHNLSQNQPNQTVKYIDMAIWVLLSRYSLSLSLSLSFLSFDPNDQMLEGGEDIILQFI
jgi:hypothetical protein